MSNDSDVGLGFDLGGSDSGYTEYQWMQNISNRVDILTRGSEFFTRNPDLALQFANSDLSTEELYRQSIGLVGNMQTDAMKNALEQMSEAGQRIAYSQMTTYQQQALEQVGYEPPSSDSGGKGGFFGWTGPLAVVGDTLGYGAKGLGYGLRAGNTVMQAPVIKQGLDALIWAGDQPQHLFRALRTMENNNGLTQALGAVVGAGLVIGGIAAAPFTGGASLGVTIGAVGAGALAGAYTTALVHPVDFARAWNNTWDGEKVFSEGAQRRARELLNDPRLTYVAKELAWKGDLTELALDLAGERDATNPNVFLRSLEKYASEIIDPNQPEYAELYKSLLTLTRTEQFQAAVKELQNGKLSIGRGFARSLGMNPGDTFYGFTSGLVDAIGLLTLDPALFAGKLVHFNRARIYGDVFETGAKGLAEGVDVVERIAAKADRYPQIGNAFDQIARAASTGDHALLMQHGLPISQSWPELLKEANSVRQAGGSFGRDELFDWLSRGENFKIFLRGEGVRPGYTKLMLPRAGYNVPFTGMLIDTPSLKRYANVTIDLLDYQGMQRTLRRGLTATREARIGTNRVVGGNRRILPFKRMLEEDLDMWKSLSEGKSKLADWGLGPNDLYLPTRADGSPLYLAYRDEYARTARAIEIVDQIPIFRGFAEKTAQLMNSIGTMMPMRSGIDLFNGREVHRAMQLGRRMGMDPEQMRFFENAMMSTINVAVKRRIGASFFDAMLTNAGMRSLPAGSELVNEFVTLMTQDYSPTAAGWTSLTANPRYPRAVNVIDGEAIMLPFPDMKQLDRAIRRGAVMQYLDKATGLKAHDVIMNQIWKPSVLLRLGFIPRVAGEELLSFIARNGIGSYLYQFGGRSVAAGYVSEEFIDDLRRLNVIAVNDARFAKLDKMRTAAHVHPFETMGRLLRQGDVVTARLEQYTKWLRSNLETGFFPKLEDALSQSNFQKALLGNPHSFRRLIVSGVDAEDLEYFKIFVRGTAAEPIMKELSSANQSIFGKSLTERGVVHALVQDPKTGEQVFKAARPNWSHWISYKGNPNAPIMAHSQTKRLLDDPVHRDPLVRRNAFIPPQSLRGKIDDAAVESLAAQYRVSIAGDRRLRLLVDTIGTGAVDRWDRVLAKIHGQTGSQLHDLLVKSFDGMPTMDEFVQFAFNNRRELGLMETDVWDNFNAVTQRMSQFTDDEAFWLWNHLRLRTAQPEAVDWIQFSHPTMPTHPTNPNPSVPSKPEVLDVTPTPVLRAEIETWPDTLYRGIRNWQDTVRVEPDGTLVLYGQFQNHWNGNAISFGTNQAKAARYALEPYLGSYMPLSLADQGIMLEFDARAMAQVLIDHPNIDPDVAARLQAHLDSVEPGAFVEQMGGPQQMRLDLLDEQAPTSLIDVQTLWAGDEIGVGRSVPTVLDPEEVILRLPPGSWRTMNKNEMTNVIYNRLLEIAPVSTADELDASMRAIAELMDLRTAGTIDDVNNYIETVAKMLVSDQSATVPAGIRLTVFPDHRRSQIVAGVDVSRLSRTVQAEPFELVKARIQQEIWSTQQFAAVGEGGVLNVQSAFNMGSSSRLGAGDLPVPTPQLEAIVSRFNQGVQDAESIDDLVTVINTARTEMLDLSPPLMRTQEMIDSNSPMTYQHLADRLTGRRQIYGIAPLKGDDAQLYMSLVSAISTRYRVLNAGRTQTGYAEIDDLRNLGFIDDVEAEQLASMNPQERIRHFDSVIVPKFGPRLTNELNALHEQAQTLLRLRSSLPLEHAQLHQIVHDDLPRKIEAWSSLPPFAPDFSQNQIVITIDGELINAAPGARTFTIPVITGDLTDAFVNHLLAITDPDNARQFVAQMVDYTNSSALMNIRPMVVLSGSEQDSLSYLIWQFAQREYAAQYDAFLKTFAGPERPEFATFAEFLDALRNGPKEVSLNIVAPSNLGFDAWRSEFASKQLSGINDYLPYVIGQSVDDFASRLIANSPLVSENVEIVLAARRVQDAYQTFRDDARNFLETPRWTQYGESQYGDGWENVQQTFYDAVQTFFDKLETLGNPTTRVGAHNVWMSNGSPIEQMTAREFVENSTLQLSSQTNSTAQFNQVQFWDGIPEPVETFDIYAENTIAEYSAEAIFTEFERLRAEYVDRWISDLQTKTQELATLENSILEQGNITWNQLAERFSSGVFAEDPTFEPIREWIRSGQEAAQASSVNAFFDDARFANAANFAVPPAGSPPNGLVGYGPGGRMVPRRLLWERADQDEALKWMVLDELHRPENQFALQSLDFGLSLADGTKVVSPLERLGTVTYVPTVSPVAGEQLINLLGSGVDNAAMADRLLAAIQDTTRLSAREAEKIAQLGDDVLRAFVNDIVNYGRQGWTSMTGTLAATDGIGVMPLAVMAFDEPEIANAIARQVEFALTGVPPTGVTPQVAQLAGPAQLAQFRPVEMGGFFAPMTTQVDRHVWRLSTDQVAPLVEPVSGGIVQMADGTSRVGASLQDAMWEHANLYVDHSNALLRGSPGDQVEIIEEGLYRAPGGNVNDLIQPGEQFPKNTIVYNEQGRPFRLHERSSGTRPVAIMDDSPEILPATRNAWADAIDDMLGDKVYAGDSRVARSVSPDVIQQRSVYTPAERLTRADWTDWEGSELPQSVTGPQLIFDKEPNFAAKVFNYGFDKVIAPVLDAVVRTPMAANAFVEAMRVNMNLTKWLRNKTLWEQEMPEYFDPILQSAKLDTKSQVIADNYMKVLNVLNPNEAKALVGKSADEVLNHAYHFFFADAEAGKQRALVQALATDKTVSREVRRAASYAQVHPWWAVPLRTSDDPYATLINIFETGIGGDLFKFPHAQAKWLMPQLPASLAQYAADEATWEIVRQGFDNLSLARAQATEYAQQRAIANGLMYIDSHEIRSQFGQYMKAFSPFWYAEENFLKRWGRTVRMNPAFIRQMQLGYMGLKSVGMIRTDQNGEDWFVYPMSGVMTEALGKIPFMPDVVPAGVVFAAQPKMLLPGFDFERTGIPQASPFVALSLQGLTGLFPELRPVQDAVVGTPALDANGVSMFVPTYMRRMWNAVFGDEDASRKHVAAVLAASQMLDATGQGLKSDATEEDLEEYKDRLTSSVRVILFAQAVGGFLVPGAPQLQFTGDSNTELSHITGIGVEFQGEEARSYWLELVQKLGIEEGTKQYLLKAPFSTLHDLKSPMPFTVSFSETTTGAPIPASRKALKWLADNPKLMETYSYGGPWLIPYEGVETDFDRYAYTQQQVMDLRRMRTPKEFIRMMKFREGSVLYFRAKDEFEALQAEYKAAGDEANLAKLKADYRQWTANFKRLHPLFTFQLESSEARQNRELALNEIRLALADPIVPKTEQTEIIARLIRSYDLYKIELDRINLSQSRANQDRKEALKTSFSIWVNEYVAQFPNVRALWQSLLRPDSGLQSIVEED